MAPRRSRRSAAVGAPLRRSGSAWSTLRAVRSERVEDLRGADVRGHREDAGDVERTVRARVVNRRRTVHTAIEALLGLDRTFFERGGDHERFDRRARCDRVLGADLCRVVRRAAGHREDVSGLRIEHDHDGRARLPFRGHPVGLFFGDRLQGGIDREVRDRVERCTFASLHVAARVGHDCRACRGRRIRGRAREDRDDDQSARAERGEPPSREWRTGTAGREECADPLRDLRGLCHRERAGRHVRMQRRERQEVLGVARWPCAGIEHQIIRGELALDAKAARRDPRERVEPMHRACDLRDRMCQAVASCDVSELVQEHDAAALLGPRLRFARQQDDRHEQTGHGRCLDRCTDAHVDRT